MTMRVRENDRFLTVMEATGTEGNIPVTLLEIEPFQYQGYMVAPEQH